MSDVNEKEVVSRIRVSNEQIYSEMEKLAQMVSTLVNVVEEIKVRIGYKDRPVSPPTRQNANTDPGPWVKKQ